MTFADISRKLDDGLHSPYLSLDNGVEVLLLHFREEQKVHRTGIACFGILRNVLPQRLVNVLRQKRRVGRLRDTAQRIISI